ncbi:MAG: CIA30 family protein [Pseudomonadota bacterium]
MADLDTCKVLIEHTETDNENPWTTVNDGVMGGRSSGGSELQNGMLTFTGITNTNGGGFSSIRLPVERGSLAAATHLRVHMKRDARSYSITLRTNVKRFGRRIAFRGPIAEAPKDNWGNGVLRFDTLKASFDGNPVPDAIFDASEVVEIGLIIYDGEDGPFEMQLKRIEACAGAADPEM